MRYVLIVLVMLWPGVAWAQWENPVSVGKPHLCTEYPPDAFATHAGGVAIVEFRITTEGTVSNPVIKKSSGNPELDAASLACVSTWQYKPALQAGVPTEVPWRVKVDWYGDPFAWPCTYPEPLRTAGVQGISTITVNVLETGENAGTTLVRSSGNTELDRAAVSCGNHWGLLKLLRRHGAGPRTVSIDWVIPPESTGLPPDAARGWVMEYPTACWGAHPSASVMAGPGATTKVLFRVEADGSTSGFVVASSSGDEKLDAAAVACIADLHYRPGTEKGQPVSLLDKLDVFWGSPAAREQNLRDFPRTEKR